MINHKTGRACILLMILFAVLAPALPVRAITKTIETIPIEYAPPAIDRPLIRLQFGKSRPLTLVLDTGCSVPLILYHSALSEVLQSNGFTRVRILKGDHNATQMRIPCSVMANAGLREKPILLGRNLKYWVPTATAHSDSDEEIPQVAGIAGISLFSQGTHAQDLFQLDLAHHVVRLLRSPTDSFDLQSVSVEMRHAPFAPGDYQIKWSTANTHAHENCWLIPDSGSPVTIIPTRMRKNLQLREGAFKALGYGTIATKDVDAPIAVAPEFTMAGQARRTLIEKNLVVQWTDDVEPVLGVNFLSRYRVTFDSKRGKLWLRRLNDLPREYCLTPGDAGIAFSKQRGVLYVTGIDARLIMTDHPVHVGDEILAIDGNDASPLSEWQANALINGYADTVGFLRVSTVGKGTESKIGLMRKSPFSIGQPDVVAAWTIKPQGVSLKSQTQGLVEFTKGQKISLPYLGR